MVEGGARRFPPTMFVALVALSALHPIASDSVLVAFPQMASDLDVTPAAVSLTFTTFLVGLAVGTLFLGPISDARGRRIFLVGGPLVFAVLSTGCALVVSLEPLLLLRAGQGFASAASAIAARAAVADWAGPARAARPFAVMAAGAHLAPMIAPVLGAGLLGVGDWRTIFWGMSVLGVLYAVAAWILVPETLLADRRHAKDGRETARRLGDVARRRWMLPVLLASAFAMGAHNAYVASSPFIVQTILAGSRETYTAMLITNSLVMVSAAILLAALASRVRTAHVLRWSLLVGATSAGVLVLLSMIGVASLGVVWACLLVNAFATGLNIPASTAVVQRLGAPLQGTSVALQGFLNYLCGAAVSPIAASAGDNAVVVLGLLMCAFLTCACFCAWQPGDLLER